MQGNENRKFEMVERQHEIDKIVHEVEDASRGKCRQLCRDNIILILTIIAVVLGFAVGFGLRGVDINEGAHIWIAMPGYIFLNLLKMSIVPLIVSSVVSGIRDLGSNWQIGVLQVSYLILTNMIGATSGMVLGVLLKPGNTNSSGSTKTLEGSLATGDIFADLMRNSFPNNIVRSTIQTAVTTYDSPNPVNVSLGNGTYVLDMVAGTRSVGYTDATNILGLLFVSLIFGLATRKAGAKGKPFLDFCRSALDVIIIILQWSTWIVPIGVMSLVVTAISNIGDVKEAFTNIGIYFAAVACGIALQQLIFVPLIFFIATRTNPVWTYVSAVNAWFVAISTGSGVISIPYLYKMQGDRRLEWDSRVSNFAIPMAVTFSRGGATVYLAITCCFLAQLEGIAISIENGFLIWILVSTSVMAAPPIASNAIVMLLIICTTIGIPTEQIGFLFAIDWLMDRLRAATNVLTMAVSVSFTNYFFLKKMRKKHGRCP